MDGLTSGMCLPREEFSMPLVAFMYSNPQVSKRFKLDSKLFLHYLGKVDLHSDLKYG